MKKIFKCIVCQNQKLVDIETYKFTKTKSNNTKKNLFLRFSYFYAFFKRLFIFSKPRNFLISSPTLNLYQSSRLEVLFNVWFKDFEQIKLKSFYCDNCGFVSYSPRPTKEDIKNKYLYLIQNAFDYKIDLINKVTSRISILDLKRSKDIFDRCKSQLDENFIDVLDYGGGYGSNLLNFMDENKNCYLIDFNKDNIKGIKNLGSEINDLADDMKFDLIICSHVLEHLSDLNSVILELKKHLRSKGIIYAEVPLEIKAGISLEFDPVTHINFFTKNSLANLFLNNGFEILDSKNEIVPYSYSFIYASWIIVQNSKKSSFPLYKSDVKKNLFPSRFKTLNIYLIIYFNKIYWKFKQYFRNKFL